MTPIPRVWVLLGKGVGGNGQMKSLADALGWPYDCKQVVHGVLSGVPNLILGASLASLDRRRSSPLEPPWPDLLIAASRRSVPVARWIRRQSGGRTRLVHLLHAQAPLSLFDLILTLPQYRLPERTNVLHLTAPLNRMSPATLREAAERFEPRFHELPRPRIGLLVGGNSSSYRLEAETAARLGRETSRMARLVGGSLLVTTSPRTPKEASDALFASLDAPAYCHRWRPDDPENPYHAYLALADRFVVTVDSASLLVEACMTGKRVEVFAWQPRRRAGSRPPVRWAARTWGALVYTGLLKPRRDFDAYHRALHERGLVTFFGDSPPLMVQPVDDLERAVARIRSLFVDEPDAAPVYLVSTARPR